ncbi:MAG: serine--tRNA ligase [Oscillospiraceae bacterium]
MLDIKLIREDKNKVIKKLSKRGKDFTKDIDNILKIDEKRRLLSSGADEKKAVKNQKSKEVGNLKAKGENCDEIMSQMKVLSDEIKEIDVKLSELEREQLNILLTVPNTPNESVPDGLTEKENIEKRKFGEPRVFGFEVKPHWEIGKDLNILDSERAAKVAGARFHFYKGLGAKLERSIINFYLDTHTKNGYTEIIPPYLINADAMIGTGQLPKFEDDMFKVSNTGYYLLPTAEVPVTNMYSKEILKGSQLPIKHCAYTACFRAEAGSAGRDTRGLIRQHQFNKVELVKFVKPEKSYEELENLTLDAENLLKELKLPYRTVALCGGDLGFTAAKTYDIEVWLPSYGRYAEISSCSNFEDYQARRASIKYKEDVKDAASFIHTLNGSGLAVGRTTAAILENYQNEDGSITVPDVLVPYMGCDVIK